MGRPYLRELDKLRGRSRVWIVMARYDVEPAVFEQYLDAIGVRKASMFVKTSTTEPGYWGSTFVYLYDLSASPKAASVSVETFPLPEELSGARSFARSCYGVFTPTSTVN